MESRFRFAHIYRAVHLYELRLYTTTNVIREKLQFVVYVVYTNIMYRRGYIVVR